MNHRRLRPFGFTLVELSIVLIIVSLLLGGLLLPLSAQQDMRLQSEAEKQLAEIRDALIGYAQINGHLPCPARSATDGRERRDLSSPQIAADTLLCLNEGLNVPTLAADLDKTVYGYVPWAELGVRPTDPWGHLIRYRVSKEFVQSGFPPPAPTPPAALRSRITITTTTNAELKIQNRAPDATLVNQTNDAPREIAFVILSHGKNGYYGTNADGSAGPAVPAGLNHPDEEKNGAALSGPAGTVFVSRTQTPPETLTIGGFDDLLVWVPRSLMINRLVAAGKI